MTIPPLTNEQTKELVQEVFGAELYDMRMSGFSEHACKEAWVMAMRAINPRLLIKGTSYGAPADAHEIFPIAGALFRSMLIGLNPAVKSAGETLTALGKRELAVRAYRSAGRLLQKQKTSKAA